MLRGNLRPGVALLPKPVIEWVNEMDWGRPVSFHRRYTHYPNKYTQTRLYSNGDFCEWPVCIYDTSMGRPCRRYKIRILNIDHHALYGGRVG